MNANDAVYLPTVGPGVRYAAIESGMGFPPLSELQTSPAGLGPANTGWELIQMGFNIISRETGFALDQIVCESKGSLLAMADDEERIAMCAIELHDMNWLVYSVQQGE